MRHGVAEPAGQGAAGGDSGRRLSEAGEREIERAGRGLGATGVAFDRVFASPLVRALRTAEILLAALGSHAVVEKAVWLSPGAVADQTTARLRRRPAVSRVLLVGHEPDMGLLAARLLGPSGGALRFQPGTIARIDIEDLSLSRPGTFVWLLTPKLAAALAG